MIEGLRAEPRVTYRGKLTLDEFAERVKVAIRREHRELRGPEGDVPPRACFYMADRIFEMHLDPSWFNSRDAKDLLTSQIVKYIRLAPTMGQAAFGEGTPVIYTALAYGMFRNGFIFEDLTPEQLAAVERNEIPPGFVAPLDDPNAEEIVSVVLVDREIAKLWNAVVHRSRKRPPRLGPWEAYEDVARLGLPSGLMLDSIKEAMR